MPGGAELGAECSAAKPASGGWLCSKTVFYLASAVERVRMPVTRKTLRPSPSASAAKMAVGVRRMGNDGALYEVRQASNGVKRWVRLAATKAAERPKQHQPPHSKALTTTSATSTTSARPQSVSRVMVITLRPSVGLIDLDTDDIRPASMSTALRAKALTLGDVVGSAAVKIVRRSMVYVTGLHRIVAVLYDMVHQVYRVHVECDPRIEDALRSQYGDRAADTWMEADIRLNPHVELHLSLVSVTPVP